MKKVSMIKKIEHLVRRNQASGYYSSESESEVFKKAEEYAIDLIKSHPEDNNAYFQLAHLYSLKGQFEDADLVLQIVSSKENAFFNTLIESAFLHLCQGAWEDCIRFCATAIKAEPDHYLSHHYRAVAYANLGIYYEAIDDFEKCISLKADLRDKYNLAVICSEWPSANVSLKKRSIGYFDECLSIEKFKESEVHFRKGVLYRELNCLDQAEIELIKAVDLELGNHYYIFCLGVVQSERGKFDEALSSFEHFLAWRSRVIQVKALIDVLRRTLKEGGAAYTEEATSKILKEKVQEAFSILISDRPKLNLVINSDFDNYKGIGLKQKRTGEVALLRKEEHESRQYMDRNDETISAIEKAKGLLKDALNLVASMPQSERKAIIEEFLPEFSNLRRLSADLPKPDSTGKSYPLFQKRTDPLVHLERVWGKWLKAFNPSLEFDALDQRTLRELDPVLYDSLRYHLRKSGHSKIAELVPPYTPARN